MLYWTKHVMSVTGYVVSWIDLDHQQDYALHQCVQRLIINTTLRIIQPIIYSHPHHQKDLITNNDIYTMLQVFKSSLNY